MSIARDLFDLRMGGLYLPSLILLIINPTIPWLNTVIGFSLLGAVYFHGLSRNTFGVGGPEENPQKTGEAIRSMQVALTGKGPHEELPSTLLEMVVFVVRNPLAFGLSSLVFMLVGFISLVVWLASIFLSIYYATIQFGELSAGQQLLVFAEYVWVSQWAVWRFYTPAYLLDETDFE